jgi:aspartyl-tRNA(Asn)/glutamyl-tRNA(Gln) amidotransferase subunit A
MPSSTLTPLRRDAVEAFLERLREINDPAIFTRLSIDQARAAADAADDRRKRGNSLGPLDGLLVAIKDNFDVAGEPTAAGSAILRGAAPAERDATAIARLRSAGAVIIGKTNMTEFAYSGLGLNPHFGTPRNAAAPDRIPGGSSSGAGVAVARSLVDLAIGTDTGGSVRIPAALNGICGFKPTASRIPRDGVFPLSETLDSVGPIARSIQTCAIADAVMAGFAQRELRAQPLTQLRFGLLEDHLDGCDPDVLRAFDEGIDVLRKAGATMESAHVAALIADMRNLLAKAPIVPAEAARIHRDRLTTRASEFDPRVLSRIMRGTTIDAADHLDSLRRRQTLASAMDRSLRPFTGVLSPTTPIIAPRLSDREEGARHERVNALMLRNTGFANFFDLCSATVPLPSGRLPVGIII